MIATVIKPNTYQDSVSLMALSSRLSTLEGVEKVSLMMGTPANKEILGNTGMFTPDMDGAGPSDLIIAIDALEQSAADAVAEAFDEALANQSSNSGSAGFPTVASLDRALAVLPEANLALISVPGEYAAGEARRMLERGLHTMIFSDNVTVEDEVALKTLADERGLLCMGPDCGTSAVKGIPLAFANVVRPGPIGIVGASGTGTQEVMCQIDQLGGGVSSALGLGGRDLSEAVGARSALAALRALDGDPATEVVVLVSKPPAPSVREKVMAACQELSKPVVVVLLGERPAAAREGNVQFAYTLDEAARLAVSTAPSTAFAQGQRTIRGLYCGGTLANEAAMLIAEGLEIPADAEHPAGYMISFDGNEVIDLGDDAYTVGRPHPMMDPSLRAEMIAESFDNPELAVLLLDVVLGYGSHEDPAGAIAPAISDGIERARQAGREVLVVASVCGTATDPQGLAAQQAILREAGVVVLPSNAMAVNYCLSALRAPRDVTAPVSAGPLGDLLADGPRVVNAGVTWFSDALHESGAPVVQYNWAPIAGGDPRLQRLLELLS